MKLQGLLGSCLTDKVDYSIMLVLICLTGFYYSSIAV